MLVVAIMDKQDLTNENKGMKLFHPFIICAPGGARF